MQKTPESEIIQRIKKLLRLGMSSSEAEAKLAMARAQELLAKHNLDAAMVQDTPDAKKEKREKTTIDRTAKYKWQKELWETLAAANFCWYWLQDIVVEKKAPVALPSGQPDDIWNSNTYPKIKRAKRHVILGRESNVLAVQMMGEYLEDTMRRICPYGANTWGANSWRTGCARSLVDRIREKYGQLLKEMKGSNNSNTTAIATLNDVRNVEYELNYDAMNGEGAYRRKLLRDEQWEKQREERERKAEEARIQAEKDWLIYLQNETPEQKKDREKREARERRAQQRRESRRSYSYRSYRSEREKEMDSLNNDAYSAGSQAGHGISLDKQIDQSTRPAHLRLK